MWASVLITCAYLSLAFRPNQLLPHSPLTEDTFYALTVARNIAHGNGMTIDGSTLTNGFQPLHTLAIVPAFWVAGSDLYLPLRLVLIFNLLLYVLTAYILGCVAAHSPTLSPRRQPLLCWVVMLCYLSSTRIMLQHLNGLETGLVLLLLTITWRYYQTHASQAWRTSLVLGVLLGLTVLARVDAAIFVAMFSVTRALVERWGTWRQRAWRSACSGGIAVLVSLPWWAYNVAVFGHLVPSGGRAQQAWELSWDRLWKGLNALSGVLLPFNTAVLVIPLWLEILRLCLLGALLILAWRLWPRLVAPLRDSASLQRTWLFGGSVAGAMLALSVYYMSSSFAWYFYTRYFAPLALPATVALASGGLGLLRSRPRTLPVILAALVISALLPVGYRHRGMTMVIDTPTYHKQLPLVQATVPADVVVAAYQTGVLGYFRDHVVNLDGKVNAEALQYRDAMQTYVDQRQIVWFADWPIYLPDSQRWQPVVHDPASRFTVYRRITSVP
jgi:4-amino-4-deoxy-L-arabinose transferase-like glycosyltransferase